MYGERVLIKNRCYELVSQQDGNMCVLRFAGACADDESYNFRSIFQYLNQSGFATFFQRSIANNEHQVSYAQLFPVAVKISGVASEEFASNYGLRAGSNLNMPLQEWVFCSESLGSPVISASHIRVFKLLSDDEAKMMESEAYKVFYFLSGLFASKNYRLGSVKLRFGRDDWGTVMIADLIELEVWNVDTFKCIAKNPAGLAAVLRGNLI